MPTGDGSLFMRLANCTSDVISVLLFMFFYWINNGGFMRQETGGCGFAADVLYDMWLWSNCALLLKGLSSY